MKELVEKAIDIAKLMEDGKGKDVVLLDVSGLNSWTDYFVITTVNSSTHWQGLYRQVKDYIKENDLEIHLTNRKMPDGDEWNLIDLGNIVVHLMSSCLGTFDTFFTDNIVTFNDSMSVFIFFATCYACKQT